MAPSSARVRPQPFSNFRGDLFGGLTAAVVALPLALAFGVASGLGPVAGLYGAIFVGFFAAVFGGTPAQVSGPTGPMTVVMATVVADFVSRDPERGFALAFTVVMMGGLLQILFGVLKVGRFINLMPVPVVAGFMSGIGVIIISLQLGPFLGHAAPGGGVPGAIAALPDAFRSLAWQPTFVGAVVLAIVCFLPKRIHRIFPAPLCALLAGTLLALLAFAESSSLPLLGNIPTAIPLPILPTFDLNLLTAMLKSAGVLALLGSIDSLLTSLVADNMTRGQHDSDRELVGQGIGNAISGLFGGLPGAGATMRTVVNIRSGGATPLSGSIHALVLLAVVLGAGPLARYIPHAALAGILIKVGFDIIDWNYLRRLRHAPVSDNVLMFAVLLLTVFFDLITAVAVGVMGASLILVKQLADLQSENARFIQGGDEEAPLDDEEAAILDAAEGRLLLCHLSGPLSFGAAKHMTRRLALQSAYDALVLDVSEVTMLDYTSALAIGDIARTSQGAGRKFFLAGARPKINVLLAKSQVLEQIADGHCHQTRLESLRHAAGSIGIVVAKAP